MPFLFNIMDIGEIEGSKPRNLRLVKEDNYRSLNTLDIDGA